MAGLVVMSVYITVFVVAIFMMFFAIRMKTQGKILAFFVEEDKVLFYKLFKPKGNLFKFDKEDEVYTIDADCVMLVKYPFGGLIPPFLQQIVPCLVYAKNNPQPLNPKNVTMLPRGMTAKQIASSLSEEIVKGIVKGVSEESGKKEKLPHWLVPAMCLLLIVILAVMMYAMNAKIDAIYNLQKVVGPMK